MSEEEEKIFTKLIKGETYYIDISTDEEIVLVDHGNSAKAYTVFCRNPGHRPSQALQQTFKVFPNLRAISEDPNGIAVVYETPEGAVECYKALKTDKYFHPVLCSKLTSIEKKEIFGKNGLAALLSKVSKDHVKELETKEKLTTFSKRNKKKNKKKSSSETSDAQLSSSSFDEASSKSYIRYIKPARAWKRSPFLDVVAARTTCDYFEDLEFVNTDDTPSVPFVVNALDLYNETITHREMLHDVIVVGFPVHSTTTMVENLVYSHVPKERISLIEYFNFYEVNLNAPLYIIIYFQLGSDAYKICQDLHGTELLNRRLSAKRMLDIDLYLSAK